ncbi:ankyrin repeat domain-containing protein 31 [Echinops telfairi]|uniref:Ankyrin repeat domain-containing protein 31 n=1 Tax=Echinops telfairi TaxID=9371 RepID=A0AC55CMT9_ECHTE|nr:ankyrin repeat domain-containing protein 31 [Echinops telfairi]
MEEGAQALDWDSDETVIEGSVSESDFDEEELPWRRLFFGEDVALRAESKPHPDINEICKGMPSPEIQLGFKLRDNLQKQMNKSQMMRVLNGTTVLQQSEDEVEQNQALLQANCPMFSVSVPQTELSLNHQNIQGPGTENTEVLPHTEKAVNEDSNSPVISLLSGTTGKMPGLFAVKEMPLMETKGSTAQNTFSEPGKKVTFSITSETTKDEESSCETFVSSLENLPESNKEERECPIMNTFEPIDLMNPLSDSLSSTQTTLNAWWEYHRDDLENQEDGALPAELLAALNILSEATVGPVCHRKEGGSSLSDGNECLAVASSMSQTDEDCTQIAEGDFDPASFGLQTLVQQNVTSCDQLNNQEDSNPLENNSDPEIPCVLRRSLRLKKRKVKKAGKHKNDVYNKPEKILPNVHSHKHQTNNKSLAKTSSLQDAAVRTEGKAKSVHSLRLKSGHQIWRNKFAMKTEKKKIKKISLSRINRKNIFGENLLYKAALLNNFNLVHHCIKKGGNVNQPTYAGWTALHEASAGGFYQVASELLKGGADVNIRGMYQITPLHDAVMNGHFKVAELLLLKGADPLFRSDFGKSALDVAKDSSMRRLLERHVSKQQKRLLSAQKSSTEPLEAEGAHQHKVHLSVCSNKENIICSANGKDHCNYKENIANSEEMCFQWSLPSEHHFSQDNVLTAGSLTILPRQEAVTFSDSDNTDISEQHVSNYEHYIDGGSFDHSPGNHEHTSRACARTLSICEASELASHAELFRRPQDNSPRSSTPFMCQTDAHIIEKVDKKHDTNQNYTNKDHETRYSSGPLSTTVHSPLIEAPKVEKRRQGLLENKVTCNVEFQPTDYMNKELVNNSQLNQRREKEISPKPDEGLMDNGDKSTISICEEKNENPDSETHMPNTQVQNLKSRQNLLKATCRPELKTSGINKRNSKGESCLHVAARRGDLARVKALIASGAHVNLKDNAGWTPLHEASSKGSNDVIIELLKAGANVNSANLYGILPLHDAVINSHLKTAEILLQHGANPNQKDHKQKTALNEADDETMKNLLKSYGAVETHNRDESHTGKSTTVWPKRHKQHISDDCKTVDQPSPSHHENTRESLPKHRTISAILQDIEEKQENLLEFEIQTPKDAEQYIEKMLQIKEVMDSVLAKQKAERDDLAKKYRVSKEAFKQGALREQLANLAARQKSLLVVAKKQKKISLKIQSCKNDTPLSGLTVREPPSSPEISNKKNSQKPTSLEKSIQPQTGTCFPASLVCGSIQEAQLSPETEIEVQNDSQSTNICLNSETACSEDLSGNELSSKQNVIFSESSHSDGTEETALPSQPVAFIAQADCSQNKNDLLKTTAKEYESCNSPAIASTLDVSESTTVFTQKDVHPSTIICDQDLPNYVPKRKRKTNSQKPPRAASESLAHQRIAVLGSDTASQVKPYLKKSASAASCEGGHQMASSGTGHQQTIKKPLNYNIAPKKKRLQIKDLMLMGKINPGHNILEFKTQEATHKASILFSGKIKVENGQVYQNLVTWLKDLLGSDSSVTWNYAWSKVTYLGKELLKYVSEEVPVPPEPSLIPQQAQPCLPDHREASPSQDQPVLIYNLAPGLGSGLSKACPGTSRELLQRNPDYLQINEILLISDQEFLPCHIMDQHWKFYAECEELTF